MTIRINCENRNPRRRFDLSKMEKAAALTLRSLGKSSAEMNIVFVSSQKIRAFNRVYLGRDRATDVIAFPFTEAPAKGKKSDFLGDVAISSDRAARNARTYGTTFMREIALYVIHGTLHLLGYDDSTRKGRDAMRRKEDGLLQKAGKFL